MIKLKQTLTSECVQQISQLILTGELLPGEKIKGEYLKNKLQVGLSPIREALSRLASGIFVEATDNTGFRVAVLNERYVLDGFMSYAMIESLLLKEAIEHGDDAWEAEIMGNLYRLSKVEITKKVSYQQWGELNNKFHDSLIGGCQLTILKRMRQECLLFKDWCYGLAYPYKERVVMEVSHVEHVKIAELTCTRKTEPACAMLYNHTLHSMNEINELLKRRGIYQ